MAVQTKTLKIVNLRGLHARAAAKFVRTTEQYASRVQVIKDDMCVCGSSIMGLLMLAASKGTHIRITTEGTDAEEALQALVQLIESRFGEDI